MPHFFAAVDVDGTGVAHYVFVARAIADCEGVFVRVDQFPVVVADFFFFHGFAAEFAALRDEAAVVEDYAHGVVALSEGVQESGLQGDDGAARGVRVPSTSRIQYSILSIAKKPPEYNPGGRRMSKKRTVRVMVAEHLGKRYLDTQKT